MIAKMLTMAVGIAAVLVGSTLASAQSPVISLDGNGQLTWTNGLNTNALYRVEWASKPGGPWHSFTYQPINTIDAHGDTSFTVEAPMFYRVVMSTNQPPAGMVWIDGGDVELGQTGIETPVHTNFVSGFWMDATEITKAQWDAVAGWAFTNGYDITAANGSGKTNNHPVQTVTWYEAVKWCNARSKKEGLTPCYYTSAAQSTIYTNGSVNVLTNGVKWTASGYRLPTEAEWEKAARGGRQRRLFPWGGDTISHSQANYFSSSGYSYDVSPTRGYHPAYTNGGFPFTSPVGRFPANGYGLHDLAGNVWEWCWDWYGSYSAQYQTDPRGPASGSYRVLRGGSWNDAGAYGSRCANRGGGNSPNIQGDNIGFRCARGR
jgi:formylglycine-generating enzyme required for sulfatase activity